MITLQTFQKKRGCVTVWGRNQGSEYSLKHHELSVIYFYCKSLANISTHTIWTSLPNLYQVVELSSKLSMLSSLLENKTYFFFQSSLQISLAWFVAFTNDSLMERNAQKEKSQKSAAGNHSVPYGGLCSECSWKSQIHNRKKSVNKYKVHPIFLNILVF